MNRDQIVERLLQSDYNSSHFEEMALEVFKYQYKNSPVYSKHVSNLKIKSSDIKNMEDIPFIPITAFKKHRVISKGVKSVICFESSGTTGNMTSKHYVGDLDLYKNISTLTFNSFYGNVENYCVLGLLPSYLERSNSSLVMMVDHFISQSKDSNSGFYLEDYKALISVLKKKQKENIPTLLIGVSFALLELAEKYTADFSNVIFMETGGMKGRKKEIPRTQLHQKIIQSFNVDRVHSEYGMTELLSQAYSQGEGVFKTGYTMRCVPKQITDPLSIERQGKTAVMNIIDLANIDSCSFIETQDLVKVYPDNTFEILGRLDQSDLRGCNLMFHS